LGTTPLLSQTATTITSPEYIGSQSITGLWQIEASAFIFRAGGNYSFSLGRSVSLRVGAGLAMTYLTSNFTYSESLEDAGYTVSSLMDINTGIVHKSEASLESSEWLTGWYAEAELRYQINRKTGFSIGGDFMESGSMSQTLSGRTASLDWNQSHSIKAGFYINY
jgi:hypothetical protein